MKSPRGKVTGPDGSEQDLGEVQIEFVCACGQTVTVFEHGMLHRMPMCADFDKRGPLEYITWIRQRAERQKQS